MGENAEGLRRRSSTRALIAAVGIVLGFLIVTVVGQHYARAIDGMTRDLEANALPSIGHLTAARGALRRSTLAARELVQGHLEDRQALLSEKSSLDENLAAYIDLPSFPGEHSEAHHTLKDLGAYEQSIERLLRNIADLSQARSIVDDELVPASERADHDIERLIRINVDAIAQTTRHIQRARSRATELSYSLHLLAALLAVVLLWMVARARRSYERAVQASAKLEAERQQLAEAKAAELDMFAARVAHDIKNPLGVISIATDLAEHSADHPDEVRYSMNRARRAIARMNTMIDGLLAFARGSVEGPRGSAELSEALECAIADVSPQAEHSGVEIVSERFDHVWVACAAGPLISVLDNLLGNAVKYLAQVPEGARRVLIRVSGSERVRVEIEDTGPGIPSEVQLHIFEPYVRGPHPKSAGLGLGLATVKRIVEAHGGSVGVRSVEGEGSRFWFELPRERAESSDRIELH